MTKEEEHTAVVSKEGNRLSFKDRATGEPINFNVGTQKTYQVSLDKLKPEQKKLFAAKQRFFNVKFKTLDGRLILESIKEDKVDRADLSKILKDVSDTREQGEQFSTSTDLEKGSASCASSKSESSTDEGERITVEALLKKANEGIEETIAKIEKAKSSGETLLCVACGRPEHSDATPMSFTSWYYLDELDEKRNLSARALHRLKELRLVLAQFKCQCGLKAVPNKKYNVFRRISAQEKKAIDSSYDRVTEEVKYTTFHEMAKEAIDWEKHSKKKEALEELSQEMASKSRKILSFEVHDVKDKTRVNHIVPRAAGGCPTKPFDILKEYKGEDVPPSNLIPIWNMCPLCQLLDELFTKWQNESQHETLDSFQRHVIDKQKY